MILEDTCERTARGNGDDRKMTRRQTKNDGKKRTRLFPWILRAREIQNLVIPKTKDQKLLKVNRCESSGLTQKINKHVKEIYM